MCVCMTKINESKKKYQFIAVAHKRNMKLGLKIRDDEEGRYNPTDYSM